MTICPILAPLSFLLGIRYKTFLKYPLKGEVVTTLRNIVNRFAGSSEGLNHWRYYIDAVEIHIPPLLVPYLQQENVLDVVCTPFYPHCHWCEWPFS